MGKVIPMPGGGADLDGLTAVPYSVLADKVFYGAGSDEPQRGLIPSANQQTYSNISWWDNNSGYFIRMEPGKMKMEKNLMCSFRSVNSEVTLEFQPIKSEPDII